jgi:hypothetical protein
VYTYVSLNPIFSILANSAIVSTGDAILTAAVGARPAEFRIVSLVSARLPSASSSSSSASSASSAASAVSDQFIVLALCSDARVRVLSVGAARWICSIALPSSLSTRDVDEDGDDSVHGSDSGKISVCLDSETSAATADDKGVYFAVAAQWGAHVHMLSLRVGRKGVATGFSVRHSAAHAATATLTASLPLPVGAARVSARLSEQHSTQPRDHQNPPATETPVVVTDLRLSARSGLWMLARVRDHSHSDVNASAPLQLARWSFGAASAFTSAGDGNVGGQWEFVRLPDAPPSRAASSAEALFAHASFAASSNHAAADSSSPSSHLFDAARPYASDSAALASPLASQPPSGLVHRLRACVQFTDATHSAAAAIARAAAGKWRYETLLVRWAWAVVHIFINISCCFGSDSHIRLSYQPHIILANRCSCVSVSVF